MFLLEWLAATFNPMMLYVATSKPAALFNDDHVMAVVLQQVDCRTHAAYTSSNDDSSGIGHVFVAHLPSSQHSVLNPICRE